MNEKYIWILLIVFLGISFCLKIATLNGYEAPSGSDPGNYLFAADAFQGNDTTGFGQRYPPVFYLLVGLALKLFPPFVALKFMAGFVSTIIGIPFFVLVRRLSDDLISLICTMFFVFSFEYFGIPAWGGYGNLLGIFFLLFFLYFLSEAIENPSTANLLFAALFFALILGTHTIVLIFSVFTSFVFVLLVIVSNGRKPFSSHSRARLKTILVWSILSLIFCLPFAPFYYLMLQDYPASTQSDLSLHILFHSVSTLELIIYPCCALVTLLVFLLYNKKIRNNITNILMAASFVCPLFIFLALPTFSSKIVKRIPVFWCAPGLLLMAVLLKLAKRRFKKSLFHSLILVLCIATTVFFIPQSTSGLQRKIEYFQVIRDDELAALSWIKEITSSSDIVLCGGSSYIRKLGWWVQGWAKRKAYSTEETYWFKDFTFQREREEAEIAARILSGGDHILENGLVRVADYSFQRNVSSNPVIATKNVGKYQNLIFLDDNSVNLNLSMLSSSPDRTYRISPHDSENKSVNIYQTHEYGRLQYLYTWKNAEIKRTVTLKRNTNHVDISYRINLKNATTEGFKVDVLPWLEIRQWRVLQNSSVRLIQNVEGRPVCTMISLTTNGVECVDFGADRMVQPRYIFYRFMSDKPSFEIIFRISFQNAVVQEREIVNYYNIKDLLESHGIDYVFVDKSRWRRLSWLSESGYFEIVFDSQRTSIFKAKV